MITAIKKQIAVITCHSEDFPLFVILSVAKNLNNGEILPLRFTQGQDDRKDVGKNHDQDKLAKLVLSKVMSTRNSRDKSGINFCRSASTVISK